MLFAAALVGCAGGEGPSGGQTSAESAPIDGMAEKAAASTSPTATAAAARRQIIRRGSIQVQVEDIATTEGKAAAWVKQSGGFVEATQSSDLNSVRASMNMTLRVPVQKFETALTEFGGYGTLVSKGISSEDVTTQLVDLQARLKVMREQEAVLVGFLRQSKTLKDSISVNTELSRVRQEIESMDAVRRSQQELASLSTIELSIVSSARMTTRPESSRWAQDAWTASCDALVEVGRALGTIAIGLLVFMPIWGPVVGLIWWLIRRMNKKPAQPR